MPQIPASTRQYILENPSMIENLIRETESRGHTRAREHPEIILEHLGIDPSRFDLDGFRNRRIPPHPDGLNALLMRLISGVATQPIDESQVTADDRLAIRRLRELGDFPDDILIRTYLAAGRNETLAANLLIESPGSWRRH
jgi:hypothetical protein